ncbi:MAG: hypothetical protein ACREAB_07985 [Blastocatellia bacterium]
MQEIDIVASETTQIDQGIEPLIRDSEFSSLDWRGVKMVEEDWRPGLDGTFTRQRFYRGARWMERPSIFLAIPTDDRGAPVGPPPPAATIYPAAAYRCPLTGFTQTAGTF